MPHTFPTPPGRPLREALAYLGHIATRCPTEFFELAAGATLALWGLTVALPPETFLRTAAYRPFAESGIPEVAWGLFALAGGLAQLTALAFRHPTARVFTVATSGLFWGFLGATMLLAQPSTTGLTTYGTLAAGCAWVYIRHRR